MRKPNSLLMKMVGSVLNDSMIFCNHQLTMWLPHYQLSDHVFKLGCYFYTASKVTINKLI